MRMPTATFTKPVTLQHRANLGEEAEAVAFQEGDKITVLKAWAESYLCKNDGGQLFNVPKELLKLD
jgi:hypothetical protein